MAYTLSNIKKSPMKGQTSLRITSDYGQRTFYNNITKKYDTNFHNGIDMTSGTEIIAIESGKVTACRNTVKGYTEQESSGNYVTIYHGNNIYSTYCHMEYGSVKVKVGDVIEKGAILGIKGSTGYSTGKHLHFGIKKNGSWTNPKPYLLGSMTIPTYKISKNELKYKIGDKCILTGNLYTNSYGTKKGAYRSNFSCQITKINNKGTKPYNINNGLGWVSESDLVLTEKILYYPKINYQGDSIVDALQLISVNSNFNNRLKIASFNGITNYQGTSTQNTKMLNLLKQGLLKKDK